MVAHAVYTGQVGGSSPSSATNFMYEDLIGKTLEEAAELYPDKCIRVLINEGEHYFFTADWRPHRINVEIKNGVIDKILKLG